MDELLGEQEKRIKTEKDLIRAFEEERTMGRSMTSKAEGTPRSRKRQRPSMIDGEGETATDDGTDAAENAEGRKKRVSLEKKPRASIVKPPTFYPCILCPNLGEGDLLPVLDPPDHVKAMCKSSDGIVRAHQLCVNSTPEVWIEDRMIDGQFGGVVLGMEGIGKDRWNLVRGSLMDSSWRKCSFSDCRNVKAVRTRSLL